MKRGDVFTISTRGPAGKPRPGIILQADEFIRPDRPILVCPLTSEIADAPLFRVDLDPSEENGLRRKSQAMVDRLTGAFPREIGTIVGRLSTNEMTQIEFALINILGLHSAATAISGLGEVS